MDLNEYLINEKLFSEVGFTREVFDKLNPIIILTVWDTYYLMKLSKTIPHNGKALEIGSYIGGSICAINFVNLDKNLKFISIDPFDTYD